MMNIQMLCNTIFTFFVVHLWKKFWLTEQTRQQIVKKNQHTSTQITLNLPKNNLDRSDSRAKLTKKVKGHKSSWAPVVVCEWSER